MNTEIQIIDAEYGALLDGQGYLQPTYSGYAILGNELDEDDNPTGRHLVSIGNNAEGGAWITEADNLKDAMLEADPEWLAGLWMAGEMSFYDD